MTDILSFSLQLALTIVVPLLIVRRDLARLPREQEARAWNDVSLWMSVVVFGPLCLPFHFTKTRRSLWGLVLGVLWMVGAVVAIDLVGRGLTLILP